MSSARKIVAAVRNSQTNVRYGTPRQVKQVLAAIDKLEGKE